MKIAYDRFDDRDIFCDACGHSARLHQIHWIADIFMLRLDECNKCACNVFYPDAISQDDILRSIEKARKHAK